MQRLWPRVIAVGLAMCLAACSTTPKLSSDARENADFSNLKHYQVTSVSMQIQGLGNGSNLKASLEEALARRYLQKVTIDPDMLINAQVFARTQQGASTGIGIGLGIPVGRHASIGLGTGQLLEGRNKTAAVLVIDISRADTRQLIWRGTADNIPLDYFLMANESRLLATLETLLAEFPAAR